jgi:hypothetical protein
MDEVPKPEDMKITSEKFQEVIKKLKADRHLAADIHNLIETNSTIRRNATNLARDMPLTIGQDVSLNARKKMQQQQTLTRQLYKQGLTAVKGEVSCIMIPQKGSASSISSYTFLPSEMEDEKWQLQAAVIGGQSFVAVCNSQAMSGINKTASRLLKMDAHGPIIFVLLDEDYIPVSIDKTVFKSLMAQ